jgi:hypothetical protein
MMLYYLLLELSNGLFLCTGNTECIAMRPVPSGDWWRKRGVAYILWDYYRAKFPEMPQYYLWVSGGLYLIT